MPKKTGGALVETAAVPQALAETVTAARAYRSAARSANTRRAYESDFRGFDAWAKAHGLAPLPADPATVGLYVAHLAEQGRKVATIERAVAAISVAHKEAAGANPCAHPEVVAILSGIRREKGIAPTRKAALTLARLKDALLILGDQSLAAIRDRAILLVGFHGAFRRSELAGLDFADLSFEKQGLVVKLRHSKTDQDSKGRDVPLLIMPPSICPVRAVRAWIEAAGITEGPLFRAFALPKGRGKVGTLTENRIDGRGIALIVKRATRCAGLTGDFSGHSLRAGFITEAATRKVPLDQISRISGHKTSDVLLGYIRRATPFEGAPQQAFIDDAGPVE
jgi:integrase